MKTYEDLLKATDIESFIRSAINDYKSSDMYKRAKEGKDYYRRRNTTILEFVKLLYTITGEAVPDNYSANYKFCNGFFPIFVKQEASYLLGNGASFEDESTLDKLGTKRKTFNKALMNAGLKALWGSVAYGFWNLDHVEVFDALEFVPLFGEEDGGLHAGIRFWQVKTDKPLRATLYEEDGYSEYIWENGTARILQDKTSYKLKIAKSEIDGIEILDGQNYPTFPIVPLWANEEHQSELVGLREKIDGFDLIQSNLCNTIDDASLIYWTITNAGGMDDVDLAQFVERMRTVKASVVDDEGSHAEAHTMSVPYEASQVMLNDLRDSLYRDAMALDTDKISAGNITATAIEASYENLNLKCDGFEVCVTDFVYGIMDVAGLDDNVSFIRSRLINQPEMTQMILSSAQFLDIPTILRHLPFLSMDEVEGILDGLVREESARFEQGQGEETNGQETPEDGEEVEEIV